MERNETTNGNGKGGKSAQSGNTNGHRNGNGKVHLDDEVLTQRQLLAALRAFRRG